MDRQDPERQIYNEQLLTALIDFLESNGVSVGGLGSRVGSGTGSLKGSTLSRRTKATKASETGARYKGRKIHTHKGHHFVVYTYTHPTWCGHCGNLLWGIMKQGWKYVTHSPFYTILLAIYILATLALLGGSALDFCHTWSCWYINVHRFFFSRCTLCHLTLFVPHCIMLC